MDFAGRGLRAFPSLRVPVPAGFMGYIRSIRFLFKWQLMQHSLDQMQLRLAETLSTGHRLSLNEIAYDDHHLRTSR